MTAIREGSITIRMSDSNVEKEEAWSTEVDEVNDLTDPDSHLPQDERKIIDQRLVRKCDLRLIPWLCLIYLLCFLDRTNIGMLKTRIAQASSANQVQATPD